MDGEPFDNHAARKRLRKIVAQGSVVFSGHALEEMAKDGLTDVDLKNVLRGGVITEPAEEVKGSWRYRVRTRRMVGVVAFRGETECIVVTAWRIRS